MARRHHVAAEEAGCRQIRPAHPRCARPTGTATGSSNCCAPPSPTARLDPAEFDQRLDAALAARTIDALTPLTADLIAAPGSDSSLALPLAGTPAEPAAEVLTVRERHGSVRRDGRWTLPRRLVLRTAWCDVMLDLTSAVPSGPELVIELRVRGGNVELVLAPGMVVDANELAVRFTRLAISRDAGDNTPETLRVRLVGRMRHARIDTRWLAPRR